MYKSYSKGVICITYSLLCASLLGIFTFGTSPTSVFAIPDSDSLGVPDVLQSKSQWCCAASSVSVLRHFGIGGVSQNEVVESVKAAIVNEPATLDEIEEAVENWGLEASTKTDGSFTFSRVKTEIATDEQPIIAGIAWSSGGGHAVVIDGYDDGSTDYIEYMDPWEGDHYQMKYSSFEDSSTQEWFGSVYNFN